VQLLKKKYFLIAEGVMDALISLLHFTLAFKPDLYGIIAAGQESGLSELASQGLGITPPGFGNPCPDIYYLSTLCLLRRGIDPSTAFIANCFDHQRGDLCSAGSFPAIGN
jgi:hypothetical protein